MILKYQIEAIRIKMQNASLIAIAAVVAVAGLVPLTFVGQAGAATLTSRSVTITNSTPSAAGTDYTFTFTPTTGVVMQSIVFQFCTTPLGACTLPTGMNVGYATATVNVSQTFSETTAFTEYTGANSNGCSGQGTAGDNTATTYCVTRTEPLAESTAAKVITIDDITNPSIPSGNNTSVYVRVSVYNDTAFANLEHNGTVAASIVNQLTITGRVQERLVFCVFALDDAAGSNSGSIGTAGGDYPDDCTAAEATASSNVDIGVVDNLAVARSPRDTDVANQGNDRFGAAMVNTNASLGVQISYYPVADTGTEQLRSFRVDGTTCNASAATLTDPCFQSAAAGGTAITAGSELFGMSIACVADSGTIAAGTTDNLGSGGAGAGTGGTVNSAFDGSDGSIVDVANNCENEVSTSYAWDATGTAASLISSTTVVDDELIKLQFAATAEATTPTGSYQVATVYIATPTF